MYKAATTFPTLRSEIITIDPSARFAGETNNNLESCRAYVLVKAMYPPLGLI